MAWQASTSLHDDYSDDSSNVTNPWLASAASLSAVTGAPAALQTRAAISELQRRRPGVANNPLSAGSPDLTLNDDAPSSSSAITLQPLDHDNPISEVTRPSLSRLASGHGIAGGSFYGLDRLAMDSTSNASTESLSTREQLNGQRRSLDELRRLCIKGKGRARASTAESSYGSQYSASDLGWSSLRPASGDAGREAILHQVEKGDTLVGIALLYGCTAQAIRTANKLWLNDPIQLRKTLYVPLDACTQPPSREVEFVQKQSQDILQMYFIGNITRPGSPVAHTRINSNGSARAFDFQHSRTTSGPSDQPFRDTESPLSSQRSSFSQQAGPSRPAFAVSYLSSTNSDYGDSSDYAPGESAASSTGYRTPPVASIDLPPTHREKKILQIVRIPSVGGRGAGKSGGAKGKSPLVAVDALEDFTATSSASLLQDARVTAVSASLTPSSSSERLALGNSPNLRLRPRSPFPPDTSAIAVAGDQSGTPVTLVIPPSLASDGVPSASNTAHHQNYMPKRRVSNATAPKSASTSSTLGPKPAKSSIISAGQGLLNSFLGSTASKQWLGVHEYEEEMQLARDYRSRNNIPAAPQNGQRRSSAIVPSRRKSSDTIVPVSGRSNLQNLFPN